MLSRIKKFFDSYTRGEAIFSILFCIFGIPAILAAIVGLTWLIGISPLAMFAAIGG